MEVSAAVRYSDDGRAFFQRDGDRADDDLGTLVA